VTVFGSNHGLTPCKIILGNVFAGSGF